MTWRRAESAFVSLSGIRGGRKFENIHKCVNSSLHSAEDRSGELSGGTPIGVCGEHESL